MTSNEISMILSVLNRVIIGPSDVDKATSKAIAIAIMKRERLIINKETTHKK